MPDCKCINASGNLLTNGNFENGTTGWTASGGSLTTGTGYNACGTRNGFNTSSGRTSLVYQDVTVAAGATVTFSGYAGTHSQGLSCSPKLSLIFRSASGAVLGQTDIAVTRNVDITNGQLAYYTLTGVAPAGTAKVRVQSSINCNYMKLDAFCLRTSGTGLTTSATTSSKPATTSLPKSDILQAELLVSVNPNPATSVFNIAITSGDGENQVAVRIFNLDGRLISDQKAAVNSILKVQSGGWKSGLYFVEVTQGSQRKVVRVIKAQ